MLDIFKTLIRHPSWVIWLILGAGLVALPCVTVDRKYYLATHPPTSLYQSCRAIQLFVCNFVRICSLETKGDESAVSPEAR
jgi:hypothetical protein